MDWCSSVTLWSVDEIWKLLWVHTWTRKTRDKDSAASKGCCFLPAPQYQHTQTHTIMVAGEVKHGKKNDFNIISLDTASIMRHHGNCIRDMFRMKSVMFIKYLFYHLADVSGVLSNQQRPVMFKRQWTQQIRWCRFAVVSLLFRAASVLLLSQKSLCSWGARLSGTFLISLSSYPMIHRHTETRIQGWLHQPFHW